MQGAIIPRAKQLRATLILILNSKEEHSMVISLWVVKIAAHMDMGTMPLVADSKLEATLEVEAQALGVMA